MHLAFQVALAHRTEHETDADAIAEVQDELMDQLEDGDVDEEQVTDMLGQISMLLFNHRQHDHEIVQVLARISQPGGTGIVDCTVTDVDEATANLLTQLDFMILDDADRQRLEDIVYVALTSVLPPCVQVQRLTLEWPMAATTTTRVMQRLLR